MAGAQIAWGLDIGTTSLKAIKLRRDAEGVHVDAFDVVDHDQFLTEPDIDRNEVIRHTLAKFLERNPVKRDQVFIGVPGSTTFARFVKLPPVEPKKIPEIVRFEAIQQIPFPLDQVNWDYQTFQSADSPDVEVGIFAMKKELVTQVLANFQANNTTVHGVQMSPLAVYNAAVFDGMTEGKGTVIIDIGAEHTDLIVSDQGRLWMRTINIGGNNFTDALAKSFKQPFARAEQLKKNAATSKYAKQIFQAMRPILSDLVQEIQRSIGHYNSGHRDSRLERIIGMGNPFRLPVLQKYLQQELKLEVVRLESFRKAKTEGRLAAGLQENILSMTTAYGLALQGLDQAAIDTSLLPIEIARQMLWREKRPWFIGAAAAVVVGMTAVGVRYYFDNAAWANDKGRREADNTVLNKYKNLDSSFKQSNNSFTGDKTQVESFVKLADQRAVWPALLADVYGSLPQADAKALALDPRRMIVLLNVNSEYTNRLSGTEAVAVPGGGGPPPGFMGGPPPGFMGAGPPGMPTGGGGAPPTMGTVKTVTVAGGAPAGDSDSGFLVTIAGYVPYVPQKSGRELVEEYFRKLEQAAPMGSKTRPYYVVAKELKLQAESVFSSTTGAGAAAHGPWGSGSKGPFWDAFVPNMMGVAPAAPAAVNGMPFAPPMSTVDQTENLDAVFRPLSGSTTTAPAGTVATPKMDKAYMFTLTFKAHVR